MGLPLVIFALAAVLQLFSAWTAVRLARATGRPGPWLMVAVALVLMLARRALALSFELGHGNDVPLLPEVIALLVSALLLIGLSAALPVYDQLRAAHDELARRDGLRLALTEASERLLACADVAELHRAAVSFVHERFGIERCAILVPTAKPGVFRGTFGHNLDGEVVDQSAWLLEAMPGNRAIDEITGDPARHWGQFETDQMDLVEGGIVHTGRRVTVGCVPISAGGELKAVMATDPGRTEAPFDNMVHDMLVVFGALLGRLMELRAAEQTLRDSESRHRRMIALAGGVTYERDWRGGRFTHLSAEIEKVIGYPAHEVTPALLESRIRPLPDAERRLEQELAEPASHLYYNTYSLLARDGTRRYVTDIAMQFRGPDGKLDRTVGLLQDITERYRLEDELRQAQKMEALGRLAGGVAHDYNNLLTSILGFGELLGASLGPEHRGQRDLRQIRQAAEAAAALTRQLQAFSSRQVLDLRPTDLNAAVGAAEPLVRRLLPEDVRLIVHLAADLPAVTGDEQQFQQVVVNLALFARDSMPTGGTLTISTSAGERVGLTVSDDGQELSDEERDSLFEPFSVRRGGKLGLASVYGIVRQCGGDIQVDRAPGGGTRFHLTFAPVAAPEVAPALPAPPPIAPVGGATVLLVEDDEMVRELVAEVLGERGYQVLLARDGAAAVALLAEVRPVLDLLLTDLVMPNMSGVELVEQVRRASPDLPVLFMSGYPADELDRRGINLPGRQFLAKPFSAAALTSKVDELLRSRAA